MLGGGGFDLRWNGVSSWVVDVYHSLKPWLWPYAPHGKEKDSTFINKSTLFFTSTGNRNKIKGNNSGDGLTSPITSTILMDDI